MRKRRCVTRLEPVLFLALVLAPASLRGQECPQGRISYIFIDNRSIFPTSEMDPNSPFTWVYRLANSLHFRTNEEFIRKELLFQTGDCLDPVLLQESARLLRSYTFIGQSDVFSLPQPDGTQHVNVYTQDEWTTRVDMQAQFDGGFKLNAIKVTEENFLGRGMLLRAFFEEEEAQRDMGIEIQTPRLLDSRWDGRVGFGTTRSGSFFEEALSFPFVGEVGRFGARQSFLWRETLFSFAIPDDPDHSFLLVPFLDERADIALGGRLGTPGKLIIFGGGISRESVRFRDFPNDVEYVQGKDFSSTVPVDAQGVDAVRGQVKSRRANRVNLYLGRRNLRFIQRRGLDAPNGIQDVQVGVEAALGLGRAFKFIQEGGDISSDDLHTQLDLFAGGAWDGWTLNTQLSVEARQVYSGDGGKTRWEDVFGEADAYLYWQPAPTGPHTVLLRLSGAGGWTVATPYQLTLGGRAGVRGYQQARFPGGRRVILSLEDRMFLRWPAPDLLDFGLSFFLDVGHIQPGEVPYGVDSGWRGALGFGIRGGLPPGTSRTTRIDLALPLGSRVQLKDLVLRISMEEVLGILSGVRDRQLLRSLRNGVRPYLGSPPW
jgi:hypothetical protein